MIIIFLLTLLFDSVHRFWFELHQRRVIISPLLYLLFFIKLFQASRALKHRYEIHVQKIRNLSNTKWSGSKLTTWSIRHYVLVTNCVCPIRTSSCFFATINKHRTALKYYFDQHQVRVCIVMCVAPLTYYRGTICNVIPVNLIPHFIITYFRLYHGVY